mmetsp:Transcript_52294/g.150645  ORF Transcript_52294/g.150645 Transcript_52294/m.150645 type:complete len:372 (+) Transcript_52294:305-1420(+)
MRSRCFAPSPSQRHAVGGAGGGRRGLLLVQGLAEGLHGEDRRVPVHEVLVDDGDLAHAMDDLLEDEVVCGEVFEEHRRHGEGVHGLLHRGPHCIVLPSFHNGDVAADNVHEGVLGPLQPADAEAQPHQGERHDVFVLLRTSPQFVHRARAAAQQGQGRGVRAQEHPVPLTAIGDALERIPAQDVLPPSHLHGRAQLAREPNAAARGRHLPCGRAGHRMNRSSRLARSHAVARHEVLRALPRPVAECTGDGQLRPIFVLRLVSLLHRQGCLAIPLHIVHDAELGNDLRDVLRRHIGDTGQLEGRIKCIRLRPAAAQLQLHLVGQGVRAGAFHGGAILPTEVQHDDVATRERARADVDAEQSVCHLAVVQVLS